VETGNSPALLSETPAKVKKLESPLTKERSTADWDFDFAGVNVITFFSPLNDKLERVHLARLPGLRAMI
jgi:hypothetical protein